MLEGMRGPFQGIFFQDIHATVNTNGEYEKPRYGTAQKGSNTGYWHEKAINGRRKLQKHNEKNTRGMVGIEVYSSPSAETPIAQLAPTGIIVEFQSEFFEIEQVA